MIVAGFGFRTNASTTSLKAALAATGIRPDALATPADKAETAAFCDFATTLALPVHSIEPGLLADQMTATQSPASRKARNTGSVAEAAALAAARSRVRG